MTEEDRAWSAQHLSQYDDFRDFVVGWLTLENARSWVHFRPQSEFICDQEGRVAVDFIGYTENVEGDLALLRNKLGLGGGPLSEMNTTKRVKKDYRDYYDEESRAIASEVYRCDIECFGYRFDSRSPRVINPLNEDRVFEGKS